MSNNALMPVLFVPHGGGPMPLLGEPNHRELIAFLQTVAQRLPQPSAIVVISAHWEEPLASISSKAAPGMLYDYYGFPPESYQFTYPAAGAPGLADTIQQLLEAQHIPARLDDARDFDHGSFVPLMLLYPAADIPVVQVALLNHLNPAAHIALGEALAPLRAQNILILGSGMSFHNMREFFAGNPATAAKSQAFDSWLSKVLCDESLDYAERKAALTNWNSAPEARFCHPREEHLLPLLVCFGATAAAPQQATRVFSSNFFNARITGFCWQ